MIIASPFTHPQPSAFSGGGQAQNGRNHGTRNSRLRNTLLPLQDDVFQINTLRCVSAQLIHIRVKPDGAFSGKDRPIHAPRRRN
jgi:hypothetical protein